MTRCALDITWEPPGLPSLVGPFETEAEAEDWAARNIPNGTWRLRGLAFPYRLSEAKR